MPKNVLVVVDMQNDFITGPLGSSEAQAVVSRIVDHINANNVDYDLIVFTMDAHMDKAYPFTLEGKKIPIKHCIWGSEGADLHPEMKKIYDSLHNSRRALLRKNSFTCTDLPFIKPIIEPANRVDFCGVCTDICVVSTAMYLRTHQPNLQIRVLGDCCAGTTPEMHEAALKVMKSCCMDIV